MRTVIIGGTYRAGKSRLANLVFQNVQSTVIYLEAFSNAVRANHPLAERLCEADLQDYCGTVVVKTIRNMGKGVWVVSGYPNTTPEQKLAQVRIAAASDPCCWSHGMNDGELLKAMEKGIELSQRTEEECLQCESPFFDISANWHNTITKALNYALKHTDSIKNLRS